MMKERLMFAYRGVVTNENSVPLLMLLENEMKSSEYGYLGRKRLFMFVLESLQNVQRHSNKNQHANMSLVVYSKTDNGYTVSTGNVIPNENIDILKSKLDEVNNLATEDIRNVYRQMLNNAELSSKGGAGLGLIEMAKKTGNRLDYAFYTINKEFSYYILSKTVDSGGTGSHDSEKGGQFDGTSVTLLEKLMDEKDIYLIWSGHVSPEVGKEVISFAETKLTEQDIEGRQRKRVFSTLVELLDNVGNYSPGREVEEKYGKPFAMIRLVGRVYYLSTGNLILKSKVVQLKEKLDAVNKLDKDGLKEMFIKSLTDQESDIDSTGNMGLIEMVKKSGNKLTYIFEDINEEYSYYMLTVGVKENINS
ncbi:MAG: hypothetical protein A2X05_00840 [Bacteroidetes bacterium GWE2_41_25]|nr:MAG: hypothetical protein A2X06_18205 [Bacteroidetes bacterium GWC2_40_22]OFX95087.1 MAG: hypothetical protein A2X05_00840 [Bacteroidetes bacterium GWE2_41_25]OFY58040.1 MAG: hypothetical protein A2X04_05400 [Bacteroidetes bacterium GWF2_41_9]HAM11595.1 hypothetical protein [Bacteroidales bacterium]HBH82788.1 hypothetical protein [Bacteroidales bacterium]